MTEEKEQIYVPRFEDTPQYYTFGGRTVKNTVVANNIVAEQWGTDLCGKKVLAKSVSNRDLYRNDVWVNFDELNGKEIYAVDDAFIAYKPNGIGCGVWDKPMMRQSDWWKLNGDDKKLIEFKRDMTLWDYVPKKVDEEKSNVEATVFYMIQNILEEEEPYTQNRFVKYEPMKSNPKIQSFKTGVIFKTRPGVFDLLVMNGRYDFLMWYFINGSYEGMAKGKGLKWLNSYLQNVKEKRNAYMKSQYANHL